MKNTSTYIVVCPHCGAAKRVAFTNSPWYEERFLLWSDGRLDIPGWCEPAWTQQCSSCKHFFILPPKSTLRVENVPSNDTGKIPLSTLKQAVVELSGDEAAEMRARLDAWWAYNELYNDMSDEDIPAEEKEYNRANMQQLLNFYLGHEVPSFTLIFELLRLLGRIDEYKMLLNSISYEDFIVWRQICLHIRGIGVTTNEETNRRLYMRFVDEKSEALARSWRVYLHT